MPKNCPECGKKIKGKTKFCPECGTKFKEPNIKNNKKDDTSFERFFKDCFLLAIASIVITFMITGFANWPIRYMLHRVPIIHYYFIDWIFWSLIFFSIFFLISFWKKLQKRDIKVFVSSISIAFILIIIVLGYNMTLNAGEVRIVDYNGHTNYGVHYYVNGTFENTGDIYQNARLYINFYDFFGRVVISEELGPFNDIPPHSTDTFYFRYFYGVYEDKIDTFLDIDHITVKCETFGYD